MKLRATRKPASVRFSMTCAAISIGGLSIAVFFHRLYATGAVLLPFLSFGSLTIAIAVAALTPIRGFGLCSAQTSLIRDLARPAVVPAPDLRILCAVAARWRLTAPPTRAVVVPAPAWRPYPSDAAAMLWRSLTPGAEESDPKTHALFADAAPRAAEQEPR
jgi:DNA-3-methyladenine glycosylase II